MYQNTKIAWVFIFALVYTRPLYSGAGLDSFVQGALSVMIGQCLGYVVGSMCKNKQAGTMIGGVAGFAVDHYYCGGNKDPHYVERKLGNLAPFVAVVGYNFCFESKTKSAPKPAVEPVVPEKKEVEAIDVDEYHRFRSVILMDDPSFKDNPILRYRVYLKTMSVGRRNVEDLMSYCTARLCYIDSYPPTITINYDPTDNTIEGKGPCFWPGRLTAIIYEQMKPRWWLGSGEPQWVRTINNEYTREQKRIKNQTKD